MTISVVQLPLTSRRRTGPVVAPGRARRRSATRRSGAAPGLSAAAGPVHLARFVGSRSVTALPSWTGVVPVLDLPDAG